MAPDPADLLKHLRTRSHFLRRLRRPRQKCELVGELPESRSTIDRALRELERAEFVERGDDGYRTTLVGELALAEYDRYSTRVCGIAGFREVLASLPTEEPLDGALFEGVDASLPTQHSPHRPIEAFEAALSDADHVRTFGTAVVSPYVDVYHDQIVNGDMTAEIILSERVLEWLVSRRAEAIHEIAEAAGVTVAETDANRSFSLFVLERDDVDPGDVRHDRSNDSVGVMLSDEGTLLGFFHNDTREAVAWGDALFDRVADEAVTLGSRAES